MINRILMIMKLAILMSIALTFQSFASIKAQKITLAAKNTSLSQVMKEIQKQQGISFFFRGKEIASTKVTVNIYQEELATAMDKILNGTDFAWYKEEGTIVINNKIMHIPFVPEVQQDWEVRGRVTDDSGNPIAGVNVTLQGSAHSSRSDEQGNFQIRVSSTNAVLILTNVGYERAQINVGSQRSIQVKMKTLISDLDEVVVVGYGTQRKSSVTGAISQVSGEVFENRSIVNVSQGLQGAIPNLNITFSDGKPTRAPSYNIRGTTSIGQGGSALILIDGVEGDPTLLNPNDIESVSVLKDASSAAIYGARGAFGVVLITTKTPKKGTSQIAYSSNYSINRSTTTNDYVSDGYLWASMFNEAFSAWNDYNAVPQNVNKSMKFSLDYLKELERRSLDPSLPKVEVDPATGEYTYYDNTDWYKELYKDNNFSHDQNLSLSGSSEKASYQVSGRFISRPGIFRYNSDEFDSYNLRAKGTIQLNAWLSMTNNTSFSTSSYFNPIGSNEANIWRAVQYDAPPMAPMFNPDGTLTLAGAYSVGSLWQGRNGMTNKKNFLGNMTSMEARFFENKLKIKGDFSYNQTDLTSKRIRVPTPYSNIAGTKEYIGLSTNDLQESTDKTKYITSNIYGEYENTVDDHQFKVLLGGNYELSTSDGLTVLRNGLIFDGVDNINLAFGQAITTGGRFQQWNVVGGFYRFNYSYKNRYLLELNGRYDGSSKFPNDERFAFFPSVSAGWSVSDESFWNVSKEAVGMLKFRFSYGSLGNGSINPYVFNETYNIAQLGRILNGVRPQYTNHAAVLPDGLTWEKSTTANLGLDASFLSGRLSLSADAYIRKTTDMFTIGVTLPAVFGAASPRGNYADLETKGWEVSLGWVDQFQMAAKNFKYSINLGLSDYTAEILKYNNPFKRLNDYYEGQRIGQIWGFETGGFFQSQEEINGWAKQNLYKSSVSGTSLPGDIKFIDRNNDGVINMGDNTVDSPGDRFIIGNSEPRYRFGLNLNAEWNNIIISTFFQGIGKQDWYPDRNAAPFWGQYVAQYANIPNFQLGNIWTEENPDAYFPRYRAYLALGADRTLGQEQTRYLQNAAYIRLKNIQLGYRLPLALISKISLKEAQIYLSGENIWTYSPFYKLTKGQIDVENIRNADPELGSGGGGGHAYPIMKSYSLGLRVSF